MRGWAQLRDSGVGSDEKAVALKPESAVVRNPLGVARYRAGDWKAAIADLEKSMELRRQGGDRNDWFFLAMAHWQLGDKEESRRWYDKAVGWMEKNAPADGELIHFRAEAAGLLGVTEKSQAASSTAPATADSQTPKE